MIEPSKIYAVWLREIKRFLNSKSRIIGSLGMPFFFMIALGFGFGSMMPGFNYQTFIIPGIICMSLLFTSIFAGVSIIWDRDMGFLKEMLVAPTDRINLVIGRILGGATTATAQGVIIAILGIFLGLPIPSVLNAILALALMIATSSIFVAFGIAIASIVYEMETFQLIMNFIIMPILFLSNAFFPAENLPSWMQTISSANPLSYAIDSMRFLLLGQSSFDIMGNVSILAVFLVGMVLIAAYLFDRTSI